MKITNKTECIIEARNPNEGQSEWDSDYISNESFTMAEARKYVNDLVIDPEWAGWEFQICPHDDNGGFSRKLAEGIFYNEIEPPLVDL